MMQAALKRGRSCAHRRLFSTTEKVSHATKEKTSAAPIGWSLLTLLLGAQVVNGHKKLKDTEHKLAEAYQFDGNDFLKQLKGQLRKTGWTEKAKKDGATGDALNEYVEHAIDKLIVKEGHRIEIVDSSSEVVAPAVLPSSSSALKLS